MSDNKSNNHTNIDDIVEIHKDPSPFLGSGSPEAPAMAPSPEKQSNKGHHAPEHGDVSHASESAESSDSVAEFSEKIAQPDRKEQKEHVEVHEVVEHEHEPDPEVDQHVEVRKEKPEIPEDIEKMGVKANTPQDFTTHKKIQLPISDDKILAGKKKPYTTSIRWLSEFCIYLLKRAHIQLKEAHGKAQRIFKG